jgi:hypothetical protein
MTELAPALISQRGWVRDAVYGCYAAAGAGILLLRRNPVVLRGISDGLLILVIVIAAVAYFGSWFVRPADRRLRWLSALLVSGPVASILGGFIEDAAAVLVDSAGVVSLLAAGWWFIWGRK